MGKNMPQAEQHDADAAPSMTGAAAVVVALVAILYTLFTVFLTFLAGPLGLVLAVGFAAGTLAISYFEFRAKQRRSRS